MDLFFEIAGDQIDGARDYQEDAFLTTYIDDDSGGDSKASALVIMADGMGGHAAGNIASNLVVSTFNKNFTGGFGKSEVPELLRESLEKANGALRESIKETPALDGMGCTMVTAALSKGKVFWVSVGDSHLYLIRDRDLIKHNEDHSYGGYLDRMKSQGVDVEAEAGLSRNMLMSAMTGDDIAEVDCPNDGFQLQAGDRVIVASDGLDTLSAGTIIQTSSWSPTAKECVQALLKAVTDENKPRQDNTTAIVVDVLERSAPVPQPIEEVEAAPAPHPSDTQPIEVSDVRHAIDERAESSGSKKGLIIGLIALVLLLLGGGAFMMMGGGSSPAPSVEQGTPAPTTAGAVDAPAQPVIAVQAPPAAKPEPVVEKAPPPVPAVAVVKPAVVEPAAPAESRTFNDTLASGGTGPTMVRIKTGTFKMGSGGLSVDADERPAREVTVAAFAISQYEITFAEYELFAKAVGRKLPNNQYLEKDTSPVFSVSWDDSYNYAQWLAEQTGKRYRLLSEAEWEYAASGGTDTPFWWGFDLGSNNAHCFGCKTGLNPRQVTRVGRFEPNPFGVYDTSGNVFEWVHDCYHPNYIGAPSTGIVWEGGDCAYRVVRGGAYTSTSKSIRVQKRAKYKSQGVFDSVGIRVGREL